MNWFDCPAKFSNCILISLHKWVIDRMAIRGRCDEPGDICFRSCVQGCYAQLVDEFPEAWLGKTKDHSRNVYGGVIINERSTG